MAFSKRSIIPNSSSSSGSAFVTPRINLSKESPKSLPNAREAFFAAAPSLFNWSGLMPEAVPIAAAFAASAYFNCPLVASITALVIDF